MAFKQTVRIQNLKGLHARATSVFVQLADQFQAEIRVSKGDLTVSGKSIMIHVDKRIRLNITKRRQLKFSSQPLSNQNPPLKGGRS